MVFCIIGKNGKVLDIFVSCLCDLLLREYDYKILVTTRFKLNYRIIS